MPTDYSKGKIYAILNKLNMPVCIGSTTLTLKQRWNIYRSHHKDPNQSCYNMKIGALMREHGVDNFHIELLEEYSCDTRRELLAREGYYQRRYLDNGILICNTKIEGETNLQGQSQSVQYYRDNPAAYERERARQNVKKECKFCHAMVVDLRKHYQTQYCLAIQAKLKEMRPIVIVTRK